MQLKLENLEVACIIGDLPHERETLQTLRLDVELEISDAASFSDDLADTVDYAALAERIRVCLVAAKCRMIERAARLAAQACLEYPVVKHARVSVTKRGAIPHLGAAVAVLDLP